MNLAVIKGLHEHSGPQGLMPYTPPGQHVWLTDQRRCLHEKDVQMLH